MGYLDQIDIIVKTLIYIPIILISIYVLYILGKGGRHRMNEGVWPNSWYITLEEAMKSGMFILWPIIGVFKIIKYILYDILYLNSFNRINKLRTILIFLTLTVVISNILIYNDPNRLGLKFLIDYSKWIIGGVSILSIILLGACFVAFIGNAENFPEYEDLDVQKEFVQHQTKEHFKGLIATGVAVAIIGLLAYYAMKNENVALTLNTLITYIGSIILMFFAFNFLKKMKLFKGKYTRILLNLIFMIPCVFLIIVEYLYKELKHTPKTAYYVLFAEIIAIILLIIIPLIKETIYTTMPAHSNASELAKQKLESVNEEVEKLEEKYEKLTNKYKDTITPEIWKTILQTGLNDKKKEEDLLAYLIESGFDNPTNCDYSNNVENDNCINDRKSILKNTVEYIQKQTPLINKVNYDLEEAKKAQMISKKEYSTSKASYLTSKILLKEPIYLNNPQTVGTYENLPRGATSDGIHNFNYSLSCWVFIHSNPSNFKFSDNKYCSILDYNGKPKISYNVKKNTLQVTMLKGKKEDKKRILFEDKNFPMQKWNNVVINYQQGTLDIFINGKLKNTYTGVIPYMEVDSVIVGDKGGVSGGICNIVYSPTQMSKFRIDTNYNLLKNTNPPVV